MIITQMAFCMQNNTQAQEYVKRQETWAPLVEVKPYKGQLFWLTNPEIDSRGAKHNFSRKVNGSVLVKLGQTWGVWEFDQILTTTKTNKKCEQPNLDKSEDLQYGTTFEYDEIKKTAIGTNPKNCHMDLNCNMDKSEKMTEGLRLFDLRFVLAAALSPLVAALRGPDLTEINPIETNL
ncbi:hypothetical protein LXL04_038560 [Taraxacum kok-saghyz]